RAVLRQPDRCRDHVGTTLGAPAPPPLDQDGTLLRGGPRDTESPLARPRSRAAVLRRLDRVPRDAAPGPRHPGQERPPGVPLKGISRRRGQLRAVSRGKALGAPPPRCASYLLGTVRLSRAVSTHTCHDL